MRFICKKWVSLFLSISLAFSLPVPLQAIDVNSFTGLDSLTGPSEFIVQDHQNQKLITVHLLSGVRKPGLYRVPDRTNLITLLSYSGGISNDSDPEKIILKNQGSKSPKELTLDDLMVIGHGPVLKNQDIIFIEQEKPIVGSDTRLLVGLTGSILSIVLFSILIANQTDDR